MMITGTTAWQTALQLRIASGSNEHLAGKLGGLFWKKVADYLSEWGTKRPEETGLDVLCFRLLDHL